MKTLLKMSQLKCSGSIYFDEIDFYRWLMFLMPYSGISAFVVAAMMVMEIRLLFILMFLTGFMIPYTIVYNKWCKEEDRMGIGVIIVNALAFLTLCTIFIIGFIPRQNQGIVDSVSWDTRVRIYMTTRGGGRYNQILEREVLNNGTDHSPEFGEYTLAYYEKVLSQEVKYYLTVRVDGEQKLYDVDNIYDWRNANVGDKIEFENSDNHITMIKHKR